jgi:hypothetical protein
MAVVYAKYTTRLGQGRGTIKGQIWDAAHPVVQAHPEMFTDDPELFAIRARGVEQATAAPGELRNVKLPAKSK